MCVSAAEHLPASNSEPVEWVSRKVSSYDDLLLYLQQKRTCACHAARCPLKQTSSVELAAAASSALHMSQAHLSIWPLASDVSSADVIVSSSTQTLRRQLSESSGSSEQAADYSCTLAAGIERQQVPTEPCSAASAVFHTTTKLAAPIERHILPFGGKNIALVWRGFT